MSPIAPFTEQSDTALVISIGRYEEAALAEIYRRHGGTVVALCRRLLVDASLAEDVTQEVFLHLWNEPHRFDPERGSIRSYLLAVAHSRAVDLLRSETSRRKREERDATRSVDPRHGVEEEAIDLVYAERVTTALEQLTPEERSAISLAYYGGYTYREVATMLAQPEGTVKSRIRSGLKKLQSSLIDAGIGGRR